MKGASREIILSLKLFDGCDRNTVESVIIENGIQKSFRAGDSMVTDGDMPSVGILISGKGAIYSADRDRKTLLRFVSPGEAVGVAGLFADSPPETRIVACGDGKSEMFFVPRSAFEALLDSETNGIFRNNLLKFLSDRVSFLNSRIDCVTAGSAERKLALFIHSLKTDENNVINIGMSMTALAHALDIGRASLYRAFDSLEAEDVIKRNGSDIYILSKEKLNEIC